MSHTFIPAAWIAWSYLPLTFLFLFLLIKLGSQRSVILAQRRLIQANERALEAIRRGSEAKYDIVAKRLAVEIGRVNTIRQSTQRIIEQSEAELLKCIAASKRKDHEIGALRVLIGKLNPSATPSIQDFADAIKYLRDGQ